MTRPESKDVLIVDDDEAIRGMLAAALARLSVTCDTAADGAEALEHVAAAHYSVVLVDLMMPRVDGGAFAAALRERELSSAERPVVLMMTAFPVRERVAEIGANVQAVIQKPFDILELAELVHDCVAARRLHEPRGSELGTPAAGAAAVDTPASSPVLHARAEEL